jgi:glycosyltransferase involved in cell wall biosynthesis
MILGSVGLAFDGEPVPANVQLAGPVSAGFKQDLLSIADLALNPVTSGSGTNLKMLEYFGSGIPVVSSEFGARGLGVAAGEHYTQAEPGRLPGVLHRVAGENRAALERQGRKARSFVEQHLSWDVIVDRLARDLELGEPGTQATRSTATRPPQRVVAGG